MVYGKCSGLPPLSASKSTGFEVTSITLFKLLILVDSSTDWLSGFPFDAESVKLEDQIPSNSLNSFL